MIALRIKHLLYFGSLTYSYLSIFFIFFSLFSLSTSFHLNSPSLSFFPLLSSSFLFSQRNFFFLFFILTFIYLYCYITILFSSSPTSIFSLTFFSYILFLKLHYLPRHFNFSLFNFSFIRYRSSRKINTSSNMSVNLIATYICTLFLKSVILYI